MPWEKARATVLLHRTSLNFCSKESLRADCTAKAQEGHHDRQHARSYSLPERFSSHLQLQQMNTTFRQLDIAPRVARPPVLPSLDIASLSPQALWCQMGVERDALLTTL